MSLETRAAVVKLPMNMLSVGGVLQPPDPGVRDRAPGEDHGQLPGPVPVVRGGQAPPVPQLGQACGRRAAAAARV